MLEELTKESLQIIEQRPNIPPIKQRNKESQMHHVKRPAELRRKRLKRILFTQRHVFGQPFPRRILVGRDVEAEKLRVCRQRIRQLRQPESGGLLHFH